MAAAVYIPQSPHDLFSTMSTSRRAPLASIPNATNSPHRALTNSNKRPRASANLFQQENEPPQKRQIVEKTRDSLNHATPRRRMTAQSAEGRVFEAGPNTAETNSFQRRLVASREKGAPVKVVKNEAQIQKEAENIRQWQKHYRKIFPTFSFYFESIPEDMRARFTRQVTALGAVRNVPYVFLGAPCSFDSSHARGMSRYGRPVI
jgi:regulatory subunit for Cdc7p protein kinase